MQDSKSEGIRDMLKKQTLKLQKEKQLMGGFKSNMSPQLQHTSLKFSKQSLSLSANENWTLPVGSKRKVHKLFSSPSATEERSIFPFETATALN